MAVNVDIRNILLGTAGLTINILALVGMSRNKIISQQFLMYMLSVIMSDVTLSAILAMTSTYQLFNVTKDDLCFFLVIALTYCVTANTFLVLTLSADRFYAAFLPIKYRVQRNPSRSALLRVAAALGAACVVTLVAFLGGRGDPDRCYAPAWSSKDGLLVVGLTIVLCACLCITIYISLACKINVRCCCGSKTFPSMQIQNLRRPQPTLANRRLTKQSSFLVGWFCLSFLPFGCYLCYLSLESVDVNDERGSTRFVALTLPPFLNSFVDPFILFWQMRAHLKVRNFIRRCLRIEGSNAAQVHPSVILVQPTVHP